jgi:hypothetical protein
MAGCASPTAARGLRPFDFARDTLAFTNETLWEYHADPVTGRQVHSKHEPAPTFSLRCFPMSRTARQFHLHAQFEPTQARPGPAECRRRIAEVLGRSPREGSLPGKRVVIPGYAGLRELSADRMDDAKEFLGGAWQSYAQRGNWRMVFPFSRAHQAREAERFRSEIAADGTPVAHVVTFPALTINHGVLLFAVREIPIGWEFTAYDPNSPDHPLTLTFDRSERQFRMSPTHYFIGGPVNLYEVYGDAWH